MWRLCVPALLLLSACTPSAPPTAPDTKLLFDYAIAPTLESYEFSDPDAWAVSDADHVPSIELLGPSTYDPPHRSPLSIALIRGYEFSDFVLELDAMQTGREYGHRDLCLFFGFQSPERFYYLHLATTPDPNAHNVFLVDGAARRPLLDIQETGVDWGTDQWHELRLERRISDGKIAVYFDDSLQPALYLHDSTLNRGHIGFGSFDDSGRFAHVRVTAPAVRILPATEAVFPAR